MSGEVVPGRLAEIKARRKNRGHQRRLDRTLYLPSPQDPVIDEIEDDIDWLVSELERLSPRVVTTVEEVEALPEDAVLFDREGKANQIVRTLAGEKFLRCINGRRQPVHLFGPFLPATVLFSPAVVTE